MADFEHALSYVLTNEGGFSDNPSDRGGSTNFGITLNTAKHYGVNTVDELKNISMDTVEEIYKTGYWQFDGILTQSVASKIFDMAVNFGLAGAVRIAQTVCGFYGQKLSCDGVYGPQTEKSINAVPTDKMLQGLCDACVAKYQRIVSADPSQKKFFRGWVTRAKRLPE